MLTPSNTKRICFSLLAIAALVLICYANSLTNSFNYDDDFLLLYNDAVHGLSLENLRAIFTSVPNNSEYLPIRDLTYCLDYELSGLMPFGYHAANLVYYLIACCTFYLFLLRLLPNLRAHGHTALYATAFFAVLPVHVESVAGIAQRKDLLSGIFVFLSLIIFIRYKDGRSNSWYLGSVVLFAVALMSKATAIMLPALIFLVDSYLESGEKTTFTGKMVRVLPFLAVALAYTILQATIMTSAGIIDTSGFVSGYGERIFSSFKAIFYYVKLLAVPHPLYFIHPFDNSAGFFDATGILSALGLALMIYIGCRYRSEQPLLSFSLAWFLICLIPVIGLIPTSGTPVAERYLFLPSAGFSLIVGHMANKADMYGSSTKWLVRFIFALILVTFIALTINRNRDWKDFQTIIAANLRDIGNDAAAQPYRLRLYMQSVDAGLSSANHALLENRLDDAQTGLDQILYPQKTDMLDYNFLYGSVFEAKGDYRNARFYYTKALNSKINRGALGGLQLEDIEHKLAALPDQ